MVSKEEKREFVWVCIFLLSIMLWIPIVMLFTPGFPYEPGTHAHAVFKVFYWICNAVSFVLVMRTENRSKGILGTVLCVAMGPMVLTGLALIWVGRKLNFC